MRDLRVAHLFCVAIRIVNDTQQCWPLKRAVRAEEAFIARVIYTVSNLVTPEILPEAVASTRD
jgi:hypothetical protein